MKSYFVYLVTFLLIGPTLVFSHSHFEPNDEGTYYVTFSDGADGILGADKKTQVYPGIYKLNSSQVQLASELVHEELRGCGGFFTHKTLEEAQAFQELDYDSQEISNFIDYTLKRETEVKRLISKVKEINVRNTILKLSDFKTRYHRTTHGKDSQKWLKSHWETFFKGRNDFKVENFNHESLTSQPSLIATLKGSKFPEKIIVLGGHADSTVGFFGGNSRAPGADDNASGIASITEVMRILSEQNFKPQYTLQFMAYAAEEVGLVGSKDIAKKYKEAKKEVIGVIQMDMTNYKGSKDVDISLISDYTNKDQNTFVGSLIDEYIKVKWDYSPCNYACSDHASWTAYGIPASFPFEAKANERNRKIHTKSDTIEQSGSHAKHAAIFSKLGVAYVLEMDAR